MLSLRSSAFTLAALVGCGDNDKAALQDATPIDAKQPDSGSMPMLTPMEAFYDGHPAVGGQYEIGRAESVDGKAWTRSNTMPILSPTTDWEQDIVKDPYVVIKGDTQYLYYSGYNAAARLYQIGLATSTDGGKTFTRAGTAPVLPKGDAGSIDELGVTFPTVVYEADAPAAQQWKLWYTAQDANKHLTIAYATSSDGKSWTKIGAVLDVGATGDFDSGLLKTGGIYKSNGTYTLIYGGNITVAGRTRWSAGLATFTDPSKPYTKQGQVLAPLLDRTQDLTQDAAAGATSVDVTTPSTFQVNENVYVAQMNQLPQLTRVTSLQSGGVTLRDALAMPLTTASKGAVRSVYSWSLSPRNALFKDGHWTLYLTAFQEFSDIVNNYLTEMTVTATSTGSSLTGPWTIDINRGVLLEPQPGISDWDTGTADNFMVPVNEDGTYSGDTSPQR